MHDPIYAIFEKAPGSSVHHAEVTRAVKAMQPPLGRVTLRTLEQPERELGVLDLGGSTEGSIFYKSIGANNKGGSGSECFKPLYILTDTVMIDLTDGSVTDLTIGSNTTPAVPILPSHEGQLRI